jgi:integrase
MEMKTQSKKASKGSVVVETVQGRLRIRFRYNGKRQAVSLGLPDNSLSRKVAENKAHAMEMDITTGNFDESLKKYGIGVNKGNKEPNGHWFSLMGISKSY